MYRAEVQDYIQERLEFYFNQATQNNLIVYNQKGEPYCDYTDDIGLSITDFKIWERMYDYGYDDNYDDTEFSFVCKCAADNGYFINKDVEKTFDKCRENLFNELRKENWYIESVAEKQKNGREKYREYVKSHGIHSYGTYYDYVYDDVETKV